MRKAFGFVVIVISLIFMAAQSVNAGDSAVLRDAAGMGSADGEEIRGYMQQYGIEKYDSDIRAAVGEVDGTGGSFSDIVFGALNGSLNLSFTDVLKLLAGRLLSEVYESLSLMRSLLVIAVLGAVLTSLSSSFGESPVGEVGFYIIYIALVSLIITSFAEAAQLASGSVSKMAAFIHALIPLIVALLAASGRYAISFVFHPAAMGVIQIGTYLINKVILNLIVFAAAVQTVNFMMPKGTLDNITELTAKVIGTGLKILAGAFTAIITLQAATAPIMGGVVGKGARLAVSAVPVVGQAFAGAVDSVFYWGNAMKNSVAAAAIVFVAFICAVPVLKLTAIVLIYKLTAALIQPVSDERLVMCLNAAGTYATLFIGAVMCVCVMFVVLLMMVMAGAIG